MSRRVGRPRESETVRVRTPLADAETMRLIADRDGGTLSDVVRRYIREGIARDEARGMA